MRKLGRVRVLVATALLGCGHRTPAVPPDLAAHGLHRIKLDVGGAHGLSGLALAADGALWTIAERASAAFRIELDLAASPPTVRSIQRWPVVGLPAGEELESLATLPGGALLIGTEGTDARRVHAHRLEPVGARLEVRGSAITLTADQLGVDAGGNHGVEGACAVPGLTALAIEAAAKDDAGRWAPLVTIADGADAAPRVHRLRLTSGKGKLSALDCWRDGERSRAIAIERHFAVTRVLAFDLPAGGADATDAGPIVPTVVRDLAPVLRGSLNLEGLVRLPDGHLIAVVDNQYGRLTGPDELIWMGDVVR